jgi:hypothetical protein
MPSSRILIIKLSLVAALAAYSAAGVWLRAASMRPGAESKTVATGTWGGEHVILEVSGRGAAVEFDCARGQITQPLTLNQRGDFDVPGTFMPEHGGPVGRDEPTSPNPARYSGHVDGNTLSLIVTLERDTLGPFTLTRDSRPVLRKCR